MSDPALDFYISSALAAALAVTGLALICDLPGRMLVAVGALGLFIACWVGIWHLANPRIGDLVRSMAPEGLSWSGVAVMNLSAATAAWLPSALAALGLRWLSLRFDSTPTGKTVLLAAALIWHASLVLPGLGQDGRWPPESIALVLWTGLLALLLAAVQIRRQRGTKWN